MGGYLLRDIREKKAIHTETTRDRYVKNTDRDKSCQIEKVYRVYKYPYTAMSRFIYAEANFI